MKFNYFYTITLILSIILFNISCRTKSVIKSTQTENTKSKASSESLNFTTHIIEKLDDGSKLQIDTLTRYRKYYYNNGNLQMEGKVTKAEPNNYRDGIWDYYNENGQLMSQHEYAKNKKLSQLDFMYFTNGNPLSKTLEYTEGNPNDKPNFKFHKIETLFYTSGQKLAERHWINGELITDKCWDKKGKPKPIEFLKTLKTID